MPELKVLGGQPIFKEMVPVSSPTMPEFSRFESRLRELYSSGMITTAKFVAELEQKVSAYLGVKNVVAVSSNSAGQMLSLKCLGLKGEVILPSFSFCATSHGLTWNNLKPVFVDVDPSTGGVDPDRVEEAVTPDTCAILGVHIWGNPCAADKLERIAKKRGLKLIMDAAQAMGSALNGRRVGGFGDAEVFSCSPTKLLTSGEGGLVATNDDRLAGLLRKGRIYGMDPKTYDCEFNGLNARMTEFNAAFGLCSFEDLDRNMERRKKSFAYYKKLLSGIPGVSFAEPTPGAEPNGIYFTIFIDEKAFGLSRDEVYDAMLMEKILVKKYFDPPLHRLTVNRGAACRDLSVTNELCSKVLTFPLYSHISAELQENIVDVFRRIHAKADAVREVLGRTVAS
ncbi:MAG: DegT/DnrJ/EryC1/StrS family aminotransferase [Elusimicrobia bacterium]|nr:DegT/DnrJ/EryC1/StrS family aminotransferase [Elusimicrobiota bacterium]